MSDLFEEASEDKTLVVQDDDPVDVEDVVEGLDEPPLSIDARRRLETLLDEKRLQDELKDFLDDD